MAEYFPSYDAPTNDSDHLRALLKDLRSGPNPCPITIAEIERRIAELNDQHAEHAVQRCVRMTKMGLKEAACASLSAYLNRASKEEQDAAYIHLRNARRQMLQASAILWTERQAEERVRQKT